MEKSKKEYKSYSLPVSPEFSEAFSHFYFAENNSSEALAKTLLPSFQTIMVFNFGAKTLFYSTKGTEIEIERCIVLGPIKSAIEYRLLPGAQILVVNFKLDAFYRFFGKAFLTDSLPINPDAEMDDNCFTHLWQQLNVIQSVSGKVAHILDFSRPYLQAQNKTASLLSNFDYGAASVIKSIADQTGQSERTIQLMHKKYFGYTAKEVARYQRFMKAIGLIQEISVSKGKVDWFEVIEECGYYDQSQLIHDFKHYIHLSPKNYLKFQEDICQSAPG